MAPVWGNAVTPLNELKRHLNDEALPMHKRLRLAKNVVQFNHFPTVPKERVVADWVNKLIQEDKITSRELKATLEWLKGDYDLTNDLKYKIIKVVSQFLHGTAIHDMDITAIIVFLSNKKITQQLSCLPENYLFITKTLLQTLLNTWSQNVHKIMAIMDNVANYFKESKKKKEFLTKMVFGECLDHIFSYLRTDCRDFVITLCRNVLFPLSLKQTYSQFFNNMIRTDNVDEIACDKSENMQCAVKVMRGFFTFPNGRVEGDYMFLNDFIDTFVTCFRSESQIIFGFYVMATSALNMPQSYLIPAMKISPIMFEENNDKIKRYIFLNMLEALLKNDVDITVRMTDTSGENVSKVEIKKSFMTFLQMVILGQLKLEGKLDKTTLKIIKTALKLDPGLIEQKMDVILPHIMTAKKNNPEFLACYTEMMNYLLETLFKLSRGMEFINQMVPHIKLSLEATNIDQFELKQKLNETTASNVDKIRGKIITGKDIFPLECVVMYGKLTSELLFRQNKDLLLSLQKDLEENCLMMLEEGFVSPSIITLTEALSNILASFLHHSKMADHTVPPNVATDFWEAFQDFEEQSMNKFGKCILKLNYNPVLVLSFLKLSLSFIHLKLLNLKYSNTKVNVTNNDLFPFMSKEKWMAFTPKIQDEEANIIWTQILLTKTMALEMFESDTTDVQTLQLITTTKTVIIKQIFDYPQFLLYDNYLTSNLFRNLDRYQLKQLTKTFLKSYAYYCNLKIFKTDAVVNNKELLQALTFKVVKNICDQTEDASDLSKALTKSTFDIKTFIKDIDVKEYLYDKTTENQDLISDMIEILKQLHICYLDENHQLTAIFVLLMAKKCCPMKKIKKNADYILQSIFELSPKYPDLYKLFPIDFIFDLNDNSLLDLLKLTIRTPNNTLILRSILETAVKKVKTDPEIVQNVVDILLEDHRSKGVITSIKYFKEPVFRIIRILLPLIAKEKKAITSSAYRSILANLQDKLNKAMLESFKNIDFEKRNSNLPEEAGNTEGNAVAAENTLATLNAMGVYSLLLMKYCETNNTEELNNMSYLMSGLELFVQRAIQTIQKPVSTNQHIEQSLHLLNVTLRYIKKLEAHKVFQHKDKLFRKIWHAVKTRLIWIHSQEMRGRISSTCMDEIAIVLKFLAELSAVDCYCTHFVGDLSQMSILMKPSILFKKPETIYEQLAIRKVSKYLWQICLKANIIEPKCVAMTKLILRSTKNIRAWTEKHYCNQKYDNNEKDEPFVDLKNSVIDDALCELLRYDLDIVSEVILAAKKISLDYNFLDSMFELHHLIHFILGRASINRECEISWHGFITLYYGCIAMLNNLLLSREELLEDRWPCFMQCYKAMVLCLCQRSTSKDDTESDESVEFKLGDIAHAVEKLTQSICKRKAHVSRIAAYAVADFCVWLETNPLPQIIRQHIENTILLLIQVSDSTYTMPFLKRALAGAVGQTTMTNLYLVYKRYHKYVGNS